MEPSTPYIELQKKRGWEDLSNIHTSFALTQYPGSPKNPKEVDFREMPLLPLQLLIAVDSSQGLKRQLSDAIFSFYIVYPVDVFGYNFEPAL